MKTCPDCAESVQEAARKCRFCGYRFAAGPEVATADEEPAPDEPAAAAAAPSTTTTARQSRWPLGLVSLGGGMLLLGGLALALLVFTEVRAPWLAIAGLGLPAGGVVLFAAWLSLLPSGRARAGALFGALALPASFALSVYLGDAGAPGLHLGELAVTLGLLACAYGHLGTLEQLDLGGTRFAAQVSMVAFGLQALAGLRQLELPGWLYATCDGLGIAGTLLFGLGLTIGAWQKAAE